MWLGSRHLTVHEGLANKEDPSADGVKLELDTGVDCRFLHGHICVCAYRCVDSVDLHVPIHVCVSSALCTERAQKKRYPVAESTPITWIWVSNNFTPLSKEPKLLGKLGDRWV